jgi:hypothetical protein
VARDGGTKPEPRRIRTGITDGVSTEVTEGLKEGEFVIVGVEGETVVTKSPKGAATTRAMPDPILRADQHVLEEQYEAALNELFDAQKESALSEVQASGSPDEYRRNSAALKSKIQVLEQRRDELRKKLQETSENKTSTPAKP